MVVVYFLLNLFPTKLDLSGLYPIIFLISKNNQMWIKVVVFLNGPKEYKNTPKKYINEKIFSRVL